LLSTADFDLERPFLTRIGLTQLSAICLYWHNDLPNLFLTQFFCVSMQCYYILQTIFTYLLLPAHNYAVLTKIS